MDSYNIRFIECSCSRIFYAIALQMYGWIWYRRLCSSVSQFLDEITFLVYHLRVTYYVEFLPKKFRGVCIVLLEMWWGVGSVLAALLALAVIPNGESCGCNVAVM